jgi:hypothetical protein
VEFANGRCKSVGAIPEIENPKSRIDNQQSSAIDRFCRFLLQMLDG